jgi:hypothetical protein
LENLARDAEELAKLRIAHPTTPHERAAKLRQAGHRDKDEVDLPHLGKGRRDRCEDELSAGDLD